MTRIAKTLTIAAVAALLSGATVLARAQTDNYAGISQPTSFTERAAEQLPSFNTVTNQSDTTVPDQTPATFTELAANQQPQVSGSHEPSNLLPTTFAEQASGQNVSGNTGEQDQMVAVTQMPASSTESDLNK
jgi:hypothetical protein